MRRNVMAAHDAEERQIQMTLTCGKCGSKAIVSDNMYNHSMAQIVLALKCLICGNRQEEGAPCRWPFFEGDTSSSVQGETGGRVESERLNHGIDLAMVQEPRRRKIRTKKTHPKTVEWELSA
jgi:ribosomal protein L44E